MKTRTRWPWLATLFLFLAFAAIFDPSTRGTVRMYGNLILGFISLDMWERRR